RVNRIGMGLARDSQNVLDVQVGFDGAAVAPDEIRFVRLRSMEREAVLLRVDRYRRKPELARGAHHSNRDLSAIGHEEPVYPRRHDWIFLGMIRLKIITARDEGRMHAIAIHGGAGPIPSQALSPAREKQFRGSLQTALDAGCHILERGGASLDAVTAAVRVLEDDPLFNAGHGAALTRDGAAELDAAVMEGKTQRAGAVASVRHIKNPIDLARRVMEKSRHVLLVGPGAEEFALEEGLEL